MCIVLTNYFIENSMYVHSTKSQCELMRCQYIHVFVYLCICVFVCECSKMTFLSCTWTKCCSVRLCPFPDHTLDDLMTMDNWLIHSVYSLLIASTHFLTNCYLCWLMLPIMSLFTYKNDVVLMTTLLKN